VVREFVRELRGAKTVILTTHNMDEAERLADRIGVVDRGRLIAMDSATKLKSTVGEGDVLELRLGEDPAPLAARLETLGVGVVQVAGQEVLVRGLDLARRFPQVMAEVERAGVKVEDVRYRQNTLEDVFISLTGRGLRE
jgi:ABC-2 type transport system ATP-binding protein